MIAARVAVVGAGWAGLAAALDLQAAGVPVTLFEASRSAGGRARSLAPSSGPSSGPPLDQLRLDNGQHILIGACTATLALMQRVGVNLPEVLQRLPLTLRHADGQGGAAPDTRLARSLLPHLPSGSDLAWAITHWRGWTLRERLALLRRLSAWQRSGFTTGHDTTVAQLCAGLPEAVVRDFIAPLALSALNTPLDAASGRVFLHVLATTLRPEGPVPCGWRGSDLLLPRRPLDELLPAPALRHLSRHGATQRLGERVTALQPAGLPGREGWQLQTTQTAPAHPGGGSPEPDNRPDATAADGDGGPFDAVILATPVRVSAALLRDVVPAWAAPALALEHQPIITLYLHRHDWPGGLAPLPWPAPLLALRDSADPRAGQPAQFALDLQAVQGQPLIALVISAASAWMDWMQRHSGRSGRSALAQLLRRQLLAQAGHTLPQAVQRRPDHHLPVAALLCERRATPACTAGQRRPAAQIDTAQGGLYLAGDALDSPWPGTLEGAVRSGQAAARDALLWLGQR